MIWIYASRQVVSNVNYEAKNDLTNTNVHRMRITPESNNNTVTYFIGVYGSPSLPSVNAFYDITAYYPVW